MASSGESSRRNCW